MPHKRDPLFDPAGNIVWLPIRKAAWDYIRSQHEVGPLYVRWDGRTLCFRRPEDPPPTR